MLYNNAKIKYGMKLQKMAFLFNALENGWTIKKKKIIYTFIKNHEGKERGLFRRLFETVYEGEL